VGGPAEAGRLNGWGGRTRRRSSSFAARRRASRRRRHRARTSGSPPALSSDDDIVSGDAGDRLSPAPPALPMPAWSCIRPRSVRAGASLDEVGNCCCGGANCARVSGSESSTATVVGSKPSPPMTTQSAWSTRPAGTEGPGGDTVVLVVMVVAAVAAAAAALVAAAQAMADGKLDDRV